MKRLLALVGAILLVTQCGGGGGSTPTSPSPPAPAPPPSLGSDPPVTTPPPAPPPATPPPPAISQTAVFVGAGDIAVCGKGDAEATARLLDQMPGTIFTTGDNVYDAGTEREFRECYEPTWGRHKARTRPSPGNHDYQTENGAPYFAYFGSNAGPPGLGYYSYELGNWHVISLNSNVAVSSISAQVQWLRLDLARAPQPAAGQAACTVAYFHHPLFSSSRNGSQRFVRDLWQALYEFGVDLVIAGHDHNYERFAPQTPDGQFDRERGIRQFVVGTGGAWLYPVGGQRINSETSASVYGVLKLTLKMGSYEWEFVPVAGERYRDSGSDRCH